MSKGLYLEDNQGIFIILFPNPVKQTTPFLKVVIVPITNRQKSYD